MTLASVTIETPVPLGARRARVMALRRPGQQPPMAREVFHEGHTTPCEEAWATYAQACALWQSILFMLRPPSLLTRTEAAVLPLIAEGLTNCEIGRRLYLSEHTVKTYVSSILKKLDAKNRGQAVAKAIHKGLLP